MTTFDGYDADQARAFAERWLPAWTGNDPGRLLAFYALDAVYSDAAVPNGLVGHDAIGAYFARLLQRYPDWVWTHRRSDPLPGGFVNEWHASVPVADNTVEIDGVCLVILRDGLIIRNSVFFDRSPLLAAEAATENAPRKG